MSTASLPEVRVKLLTLSYRSELAAVDSLPLDTLLAGAELLRWREYFFVLHGVPHLLCVVTYRPHAATLRHPPEDHACPLAQASRGNAALDAAARTRFEALRRWRAERARRDGVPAYVLFTNRELTAIANQQPATKAALLQIDGVGEGKVARYGDELLNLAVPAATAQAAGGAP